jgi:hypothetical protein
MNATTMNLGSSGNSILSKMVNFNISIYGYSFKVKPFSNNLLLPAVIYEKILAK